jgi:multiple sugar transport system permease protein
MSVTSLPQQTSTGKVGTLGQREERLAYMMVAPSLLIVFLIVIFPFVWNIWLAFKSVELRDLATANLWNPADLTLANFERIFRGVVIFPLSEFDLGRFGTLLSTTLIYTFGSTLLTLLMGLAAALLARDAFPGRQIFRGTILFPYIAPVVAVAFIWRMMLNAQFGVVNELGSNWFGMPRTDFLTQRFADISLFGLDMRWPLALTVVILFEGWRNFPFACKPCHLNCTRRRQWMEPYLRSACGISPYPNCRESSGPCCCCVLSGPSTSLTTFFF